MSTKNLEGNGFKNFEQLKREIEKLSTSNSISKAVKENKKNRTKRAVLTTTAILTAGATIISPVIIYHKRNEEYEISIESPALQNFQAYTITVKRGATISTLHNKLNVIEGHVLEGIYKDEDCTIPYESNDKVSKNTQVYLKYKKETYPIHLPTSNYFTMEYSSAVDINKIEWGESFNFLINLTESHDESDVTVFANGEMLIPDENGYYQISFVDKETIITIEGVEVNSYNFLNLPSQVEIFATRNDETVKLKSNSEIYHGETLTVSYNASENHVMSKLEVNGAIVSKNQSIIVTNDLDVLYEEVESVGVTFVETKKGYKARAVNNMITNVVIPSTYNNGQVVELGSFAGCENLNSINIPEGITSIDENAFVGCVNLQLVTVESETIFNAGNSQNSNGGLFDVAGEIRVKQTITSNQNNKSEYLNGSKFRMLENDEYSYYYHQNNLTTLHVPNGVTDIPNEMFAQFDKLTSVTMADSVESIGNEAFRNCENLQTVIVSSNVSRIAEKTFFECENLEKITLPDGLETIDRMAFYECNKLTSINVSNNVTEIGSYAFYNCNSLKTINLPNNLKHIYSYTFYGCEQLLNIVIPNDVVLIGDYAFYNNQNAKYVTIPESVISFGENVLSGGRILSSLEINTYLYNELVDNKAFGNLLNNAIEIKVKKSIVDDLSNLNEHLNSDVYFKLEDEEFYYYLKATSINLDLADVKMYSDGNVTYLGTQENPYHTAFYVENSNLEELIIPEGCVTIAKNAFANCASLKSVIIPNSVIEIGSGAFQNCQNLTNVELPNSITELSASLFNNCNSLTEITISENVVTINGSAFYSCANLQNVNLPSSLETIKGNAFAGCHNLKSFVVPSSVTLMDDAFGDPLIQILDGETKHTIIKIITINSPTLYNALTDSFACGKIVRNVNTVRVLKTIVDDEANVNEYFNDPSKFYKLDDGDYYTYLSVGSNFEHESITIFNNLKYMAKGNNPYHTLISIIDKTVSEVEIVSECKEIGSQAFYKCENLQNIRLPESLETIGNQVFYECKNLLSITIPETVANIGDSVFYGCTRLSNVKLPQSLTEIPKHMFYNCDSLVNIVLPENVQIIKGSAFGACELLKEITIPSHIKTIESYAFSSNLNLKFITIESAEVYTSILGNSSKDLGGALGYATQIIVPINIVDSNTNTYLNGNKYIKFRDSNYYYFIPVSLVNSSVNYTQIIQEGYVTYLGTEYNMYHTLLYVDFNAEGTIEVADSCVKIVKHAFSHSNVENVVINTNQNITIDREAFKNCGLKTIELGESVTSIEPYTFQNCENLTDVILSNSIVKIGEYAFSGCKKLININLPDSILTIGSYMFKDCSELANVELPTSITQVGYGMFSGCVSLTSIVIPENIETIDSYAFNGCSNLTSVTLTTALTKINSYAFYKCANLTEIDLPSSLTTIGSYAFGQTGLISVVVPEGVKTVAYCAFTSCLNLTTIILPSTLKTISSSLFLNCSSLINVQIAEGTTTIDSNAFQQCVSLKSIVLPTTIKSVSNNVFSDCKSLESLTINEGIQTFNDNFSGCDSLKVIKIPSTTTTLVSYVFSYNSYLSTVIIDSVTIYNNLKLSQITYPKEFKVLKTIVDDENNANSIFNSEMFTKVENESSDYYTFIRK